MSARRELDADQVAARLRRMAEEVHRLAGGGELAVVGILRGGAHLAGRFRRMLTELSGREPPLGSLDIALYRDDLSERAPAPVVGPTDIRFDVRGRTIVLVDDVLYTGRTVRAALDEIVDFGRPRRVVLAVLVDRGGRELPIQADVVGLRLEVPASEQVEVRLTEGGAAADEVIVKGRGA